MSTDVKTEVLDSDCVLVSLPADVVELSAQDAYDLYCALHSILPQLNQPFKPYPR